MLKHLQEIIESKGRKGGGGARGFSYEGVAELPSKKLSKSLNFPNRVTASKSIVFKKFS